MNWVRTTLGEVVEIYDHIRVPLNAAQRTARKGPYPYYGAQGIIDSVDDYLFDGRYLLIPEDGENLNSRKLPIAFFASGRFWVNNHAHILRGRTGIAGDEFLKHALTGTDISGYITGAAQPKLSQENLKRIELRLPPLDVQHRIAGILSAYDDLVGLNTRLIAILEEMARRLFDEWFVKFRFPDSETTKFLQKDEHRVPADWPFRPFSDAVQVLSGGTPRKAESSFWGGNIPFFTPTDAKKSVFATETTDHITETGLAKCASQRFAPWTVFITARGTVGRVLMAAEPMAINQSCYALQGRDGYPQTFVYELTRQAAAAFKQMAHGAVFDTIVTDTFDKHEVFLPSVALAQRYDHLARPLYESILVYLRQNSSLRAARDLLLPKLISGEIDVSGAEPPVERVTNQAAAE